MTTKTKTTVSAAIDAINEVASPLDFSFKALAELQGLFMSFAVFDILVLRVQLSKFPSLTLTEDLSLSL